MNHFDLRQLRYFVAVAEELHFGRAALRLHISQPPLSQAIAGLEAALGVPLFVRSKRSVEITSAGVQLLQDARAILADAQKLAARSQAAAAGQIGNLQLGLNYTAPLNPLMPALLHHFSQRYPQIGLELHENTSAKQLDGLYQRQLDLCFIWPTQDDNTKEIVCLPISDDRLQMVVGARHPLARKKQIAITDLKDVPIYLTLRQTRMPFFQTLLTACRKAGFALDIRTHIIQLPFILNVVAANHAMGFLPEFLNRIRTKETVFKPCDFLPETRMRMAFALAYRPRETSPLVHNFIVATKEFLAK